ncbi:uncharacterized protein LOC119163671 isoform X2 [Rhipicephalus microplus]|uniref:uncharacterized protein LOC119163671 isoform X2 n=1 Tax=Rhipicephalus microplus TaxID=6941 RepID=UPI003F6D0183
MAACSEQEIDGILSTDLRSNFPVSPAPIPNSEVISKHSRTRERSLSKKVSNNERLGGSSSNNSGGVVAKALPQQWRAEEEGGVGERDINQLSDDAFESVLRELVECKPQARSSSLVRSLRREVRDQEELFDGSLHALPLLSSSASGGHHQSRHHHRPGGSLSLQDLATSSPMPSSSMVRPRGGGVPNPAGRGMRQVNVSRLADARTVRLDHHVDMAAAVAGAGGGAGSGNSCGSEASRAEEEKPSAAVAALGRVDEPSCAIKFPLLIRPGKNPQPDQELVTIKNGSSMSANEDVVEMPTTIDHGPRRVTATVIDHNHTTFIAAKEFCMDKDGRMSFFTGDTGTVTAIAQSRIRDGELHSNNGSYSARKSKRSRNHVDPTVMAEQMTGHRGSDSIDTLLAYIYSDDKSGAPNSSNNGGNSVATENRKGKNVRKGTASSSSNSSGAKNSLSSPPPGQAEEKEATQEGLSEDVINNNFDSSHRRAVFEDTPLCGGGGGGSPNEKERSFSPSFYSDYGTETELAGCYRVDLSSYSDVDQIQESEFRLVTKKPRRRAQLKKAATTVYEGFHRPLGGGGGGGSSGTGFGSSHGTVTGNGVVHESTVRRPGVHSLESLSQPQPPQQHQQRNSVGAPSIHQEPPATAVGGGRQHNYTGSAPPSEPSSPENSDLDSVHSLPVSSGSGVAATMILQTSYADIARMSCRQGRGGTSGNSGGGCGGAAAPNLSVGAENSTAVVVPSQQTAVQPTSQGTETPAATATTVATPTAGDSTVTAVSSGSVRENVSSYSTECYHGGESNRSSSPAVVLLDDICGTPPSMLSQITFGFDVNEQLVQMSLNSQFQCVPSGGTLREGGEPAAMATAAPTVVAPPRFDGRPEELGRFNHRDVVDFLDWEWVRACQSYEKEGSSDSKTRVLYYCDSSSSSSQRQQNS